MNNQNSYGEKVTYTENKALIFPDFTIQFMGERREEVSGYPRGFLYYDFEVSKDFQKQTVSWSSGMGDIGPNPFKFDGQDFLLERASSDVLGKLKEDEMVVWTRGMYEEEMEKR